jgi:hypothetical protein
MAKDQTIFMNQSRFSGKTQWVFPSYCQLKNRPRKPEKTQFLENHDPKIATGKNHVFFTVINGTSQWGLINQSCLQVKTYVWWLNPYIFWEENTCAAKVT